MRFGTQFAWLLLALLAQVSVLPGQTPPPSLPAAPASAAGPQTAAPAQVRPPEVTLRGGLLTIKAENSTLGDVLKAVQQVTGASIENPGDPSERVYFQGGPAAPRDVLASLLNGSRYDYILLGSPQQPGALTRIILTMRQHGGAQPTTTVAAAPANNPAPADTTESEEPPEPAVPLSERGASPPPQPAPGTPAPPGAVQPAAQPAPGQTNQSGQVKSPEQMLQELQKLQQQQQQQLQLQQQLNEQNKFSR